MNRKQKKARLERIRALEGESERRKRERDRLYREALRRQDVQIRWDARRERIRTKWKDIPRSTDDGW